MLLETPFDRLQIGDRWASRGRTITETDIVLFSSLSGDWYPLHTDSEYAAKTRFGARIAQGLLVLSVATGLIPLPIGSIIAFYGIDKIRFVKPVFIGDTVRVELEVVAKEERGTTLGLVTLNQEVKNQRGETVVVSMPRLLVKREQSSGGDRT